MDLRQLAEQTDRVFPAYPQVARYFPGASIENARQRLTRLIGRGEGLGVAIGSAGTGKSLLLQVLAAQFREKFDVVLLACSQFCTRRALFQAIHFELGLEHHCRDEGQLRLNLLDQLLNTDQTVDGLLLLVDEAQALPIALLEELRVLTNLARGGTPWVRLVLAGLPSLEERLASPELESFSQRLAARCYVGNLTRVETVQYVRAQLAASSADPDQFIAPDTWTVLYDATDGVPRLVNQLCDRTLTLAVERHAQQIDRALVQAAWADLQQLPTPWEMATEENSASTDQGGVVEFGSLDAEPLPTDTAARDVPASQLPARDTPAIARSPLSDTTFTGVEAEVVEPTEIDAEETPVDASASSSPANDEPVQDGLHQDGTTVADGDARTTVAASSTAETTAEAPSSTPSRPRVLRGFVPEATDPFTDKFEEEELVLDCFAAISCFFHAETPQVENRHDPVIAQMLEQTLHSSEPAAADADQPNVDVEPWTRRDHEPERPAIRLAVVAESAVGASEQLVPDVSGPLAFESQGDDAKAVLIIEDEPTEPHGSEPGVRRKDYRHLFSRLRHGT